MHKIHPCLPSFKAESTASAPLTRIRDIAHRGDILHNLKVTFHGITWNFGGKKPKPSKDNGPSLMELSGYNPKRQEFDPEYDNDAEQLLAEMEFKEIDTEE
ncbi:Transcriptional adapter ada2 [Sarracenia purpurea var. burkii]